ncbi:hypothetical protein DACRYDRAFT_98502 [Dacryopinax primogenitus]|uniref:Malate dehydrogenase n=1 Tax=Dacryopinax primogenitus (strain DJM 731) TaxID=1858805 RepID=M5G300_DACPD|nr:uncharacterized protein DACRYDRAFT_98502 [Dacryopinax primogenitus]EJU04606.1 hypothetical protein DACRYDRAFT_98502 [Dacryopinax primogenitus]
MYGFTKLAAAALAALPLASALPLLTPLAAFHTLAISSGLAPGQGQAPKCNITQANLAADLPANLISLLPPSDATLSQVTIGFGTQNYTCTNGKFVNVGALAQVFDISCVQELPAISASISAVINEIQGLNGGIALEEMLAKMAQWAGFKLADHYFDTSSGSLAPVFNFQVSGGDFVIGKKVLDIADPFNPVVNVDWLQLSALAGDAAKFLVREQTAGGQAPATCTVENETLQVPYAAKYWFFA